MNRAGWLLVLALAPMACTAIAGLQDVPPAVDGGARGDSGSSSGGASDGPPSAYCAGLSPAPIFCDDFDEGPLAPDWASLFETGGSSTLDSTYWVSPPDAMLVTVSPEFPANQVAVGTIQSFPGLQGAAGTYTLTFDVRVDAGDTSSASDAVLGAIQLQNGPNAWELQLEVSYDATANNFSTRMSEYSPSDAATHAASASLAMGSWTTVSLAITLPPGAGGEAPATMSFNGAQVVSATVDVTVTDTVPQILLGAIYATAAASGWAIRYDNVTFR